VDGMRGRGRGSGVRAGALEQAPLAITVFALAANLRETGVAWRRLSVCRPQAGYRFVGGDAFLVCSPSSLERRAARTSCATARRAGLSVAVRRAAPAATCQVSG